MGEAAIEGGKSTGVRGNGKSEVGREKAIEKKWKEKDDEEEKEDGRKDRKGGKKGREEGRPTLKGWTGSAQLVMNEWRRKATPRQHSPQKPR